MGKERSVLPAAGCRGVHTRHSRCDGSFLRHGPLRARDSCERDRGNDPRLLRTLNLRPSSDQSTRTQARLREGVIGKQSRLANVFQSHRLRPFHAREGILVFRGRFHGPKNFCCKTAQFCATRRESEMAEIPSVAMLRNAMKTPANTLS
jgi:hypothetical protein